jgi:hypothetical protein
MVAVKRPVQPTPEDANENPVFVDPAGVLLRRTPRLCQYLTDNRWEDGSARETSTITVFLDAGRLKLVLSDRALGRSAFVSGMSLEELLDAVEAGLEGDCLEWRTKTWNGGKKK